MRAKLILIISFLLTMALLPIMISKFTMKQTSINAFSTADEVKKIQPTEVQTQNKEQTEKESISEKETAPQSQNTLGEAELCGLVAANYNEIYSEETLKALAIILYTNYTVNPDSYDLTDNEVCLLESDAENSTKENYSVIQSAVSSVYKKTLCTNGKAFYIPFCYSTNGKTSTNSEYPYLTAVASPWDSYNEIESDTEYYGVSLYGINYLCSEGYTYDEALIWYLPDFKIQ